MLLDLAFLLFDFVAAEVLLGLGENDVLAEDGVVFAKRKLVRSIHGVFLGVVLTNAGFFGNETDELALGVTFLCHNVAIVAQIALSVNCFVVL